MADINQAVIEGRLTDDAEKRTTTTGKSVCNFTVATSSKFGEKEITDYHRCVAWGYLADDCASLQKGTPVYVRGKIHTSSWDDKEDGKKRYKTEVVAEVVYSRVSAEKKTLIPPPTQETWPSFDINAGIRWPEPLDDGTSYSELNGRPVCAVWENPKEPSQGGKSYLWDKEENAWVDWKPIGQEMPF